MGWRLQVLPASLVLALGCVLIAPVFALGVEQAGAQASESPELRLARQHYFSGRYTAAAEAAAPLTAGGPEALAAYELRTSALHFELKRVLGDASNKGKALKQCAGCQPLIDAFMKDLTAGKALARTALKTQPESESALFYLGKLDLNYVWLQLSTLGKRTGWGEFWNARRSIEAVLKANPKNVRARVAHGWIEYIVDTRVPFGLAWTLGGGDKKKALKSITEAAAAVGDLYEKAEAEFALWEMLVRDKRPADALVVARRLIVDFPENKELQRFIAKGGEPLSSPVTPSSYAWGMTNGTNRSGASNRVVDLLSYKREQHQRRLNFESVAISVGPPAPLMTPTPSLAPVTPLRQLTPRNLAHRARMMKHLAGS